MPPVSIIHPSRSRPSQCIATVKKWLSMADDPGNIEYIVSTDTSDPYGRRYNDNLPKNVVLIRDNHKTAIQAINNAAKHATGDIIIVVSDDTDCFEHWDTELLKALQGKEDFVAKVKDGIQDFIITMPVCDRKWYSRYGYIYDPAFQHLWCDSALSCIAWMTGRYIKIDLTFEHLHYSKGKSRKDAVNIKNDRTWKQGEDLFYSMKSRNFDMKPEEIINEFPYFAGYKNDV